MVKKKQDERSTFHEANFDDCETDAAPFRLILFVLQVYGVIYVYVPFRKQTYERLPICLHC